MEKKMKNIKYNYPIIAVFTAVILIWFVNCTRDFEELELAGFPTTPEIFIDGFSAGLNYAAFGGSKVTAFDVDQEVKFSGSASMKIEVPDAGDPEGAYAGGVYFTTNGRDLSGYTALTFWAKGSKSASIDIVGFGNDMGQSKYLVSLKDVSINSNWQKYIIPIPDPSKLKEERGMFYYSEGPEEGLGYTFWIDEVKFENLGTIAHKQAMIFDGNDELENAVNGSSILVSGLSVSFNMPTGIDQTFMLAPSYFSFSSSDNSVATVDGSGMVSVLSAGTAIITASAGGADASGSLTIESSGEFIHAPDPTAAQEDVISIFSDAYTNVAVDFYNGYWEPYQTTLSSDFTVNDDDVLFYTNFNFVGIQFTSPTIDASDMTHLHMDVWIPNTVDASDKLAVKVVDMGPDGALDGTDPTLVYEISGPLASQSWISVDIALSSLSSKSKLAQIILEKVGTTLSGFYLDNVYLYGDGGGTVTEPTEAAPTPPARDAADVISIYGDSYTNLIGTDYPDWGQATLVSDVSIVGENTLKFTGLDFQGIQLASSQNISGMEYLHIDYWTANSTALNTYLISTGPVETAYALTVPTTGWTSVDIPLSSFSAVDLADLIQFKFDGNGDIYLDNIYIYKTGGSTGGEPTEAAPTPTEDAANVLSIYSDAYTNIAFDNFDAGWCGGAAVTGVMVAGNNTLKKNAGIDCQGIDFSSNKQDLSAYTHIHFDFYTDDTDLTGDVFNVKLVDFAGGGGEASALEVNINTGTSPSIAAGSWVSVDVDITSLGGVVGGSLTRSDIAQIGITTANLTNVWYDNIYFYSSGGSTATEPTVAAPTPPSRDVADVISLFSGAYTDISGTDFNPGWGQTTVVTTEDIVGNSTLKYANFNFQGTVIGSTQNVSAMEYLHIDMWTADATVVQVSPINSSGTPTENLVSLTPISAGQWNSYDIPLTDFTSSGMSLDAIFQMKFDGQAGVNPSNIYLDNIYFYKAGGSTATEPTVAAPTPTRDAAEIISIYSDAYTDISGVILNPGWGQATVVTEESIAGNNTQLYTGLDYQGIDFDANHQDVSDFEFLHLDFWTANSSALNIYLISPGSEKPYALTAPTSGSWTSIDIPLTEFSSVDLTNAFQLKFDGNGDIYIDNIYFFKGAGGSGVATGPTEAAPIPTEDASNVVSIYSDTYTDITIDNFDAGWCGGAAVTAVTVAGNNTLKKNSGIECQGIDFSSNRQDLSAYTHIHFDIYTDDTDLTGDVFNVKLVDFAGGAGEASALEVNINTGTTPAIVAGTWVSVDIDITSLGGIVVGSLTRSDVAQIGITTANLTNVWYDNIYLYK